MKSILFVDDEPRVLEALQRTLRPQRNQWDMMFVASGPEALALFATTHFDVIVTDVRMPVMDGAALLQQVRELYPGTIRIVLSGDFEMSAALRASPVAHRFLAKPCDPEKLREAIERASGFAAMLPDAAIRRITGAVGRLPELPSTVALLMEAIGRPDVSIQEVGGIIEKDVGITAKILQLVNSAFFSHIKEVTSIPLAVSYIGLDALRQIALSAAVFHTFQPVLPVAGFCFSSLGKHSWLAARIAAQLPSGKNAASAGIVASILHDAGKLVLASRMPHEFERAIQIGIDRGAPLHEVEEEVVGANHAEIGAYLLGLWGLPETVVEAVWRHHSPFVRPERDYGLDVLGITHIADALANETADPAPANVLAGGLNMEYLEQRNAVHLLDEWREMARRTAREERARN